MPAILLLTVPPSKCCQCRKDLLCLTFFSFIPIHWYDVDIENFKSYVENFHTQTNLDIWITEYACQNFNGGAQCTDQESRFRAFDMT